MEIPAHIVMRIMLNLADFNLYSPRETHRMAIDSGRDAQWPVQRAGTFSRTSGGILRMKTARRTSRSTTSLNHEIESTDQSTPFSTIGVADIDPHRHPSTEATPSVSSHDLPHEPNTGRYLTLATHKPRLIPGSNFPVNFPVSLFFGKEKAAG